MKEFNALIISADQRFCNEMVQMLRSLGVHAGAESDLANTLARAVSAKATHVLISHEFSLGQIKLIKSDLNKQGFEVIVFVRDCGQEVPVLLRSNLQMAGFHSVLLPPISATRMYRKLMVYKKELVRMGLENAPPSGHGLKASRKSESLDSNKGSGSKFRSEKEGLIVVSSRVKQTSEKERFPLNRGNKSRGRSSQFVTGGADHATRQKPKISHTRVDLIPEVQLVADALESTLEQWQQSLQQEDHHPRGHSGSVVVLQSEQFSGIVVIANYAENRLQALNNVNEFSDYLKMELKHLGGGIGIRETYTLPLEPEGFMELSKMSSEFTMEDVHRGTPLLLSVFDSTKVFPVLRSLEGEKMKGVALKEIEPGVKLNFDLYLHLPVNNRFFRYVNHNRYLLPEQKERLTKKVGAESEVFVSEDQVSHFEQYYAGQYFKKGGGGRQGSGAA